MSVQEQDQDQVEHQLPGRRWRRPLIVAVVVAATAVAVVRFAWSPEESGAGPSPTASAALPSFVEEVEGHVVELLSYTPKDVRSRLDAEGAYLTDEFAKAFDELTRTVIAPDAVEHEVTVKAKAVDTGLSSSSDDKAELLVFVETTTTSSRLSEPRVDGARLRVSVRRIDGDWLITELDPV